MDDSGSRTQFILLAPMRFQSDAIGMTLTVPAGAETDGPSIPAMLAGLLGGTSIGFRAAVLHDWLCRSRIVPRETADKLFREALYTVGVPAEQAESMYAAVRAWGGHTQHAGDIDTTYLG